MGIGRDISGSGLFKSIQSDSDKVQGLVRLVVLPISCMNKDWFHGPAHDADRSLHVIRVVVAFILITHPLYALLHPANVRGFGHILAAQHIAFGMGLAWAVMAYWPRRIALTSGPARAAFAPAE